MIHNGHNSTLYLPDRIKTTKGWFLAMRPRTLPVSLPPIILGSALAATEIEHLNWFIIFCTLFCSLSIQIGTNLVNDAIDFKKGADAGNRLGPKRMTQEGILPYNQVLRTGCLCFVFALICGIPLIITGGWPLAAVLLISVACGYCYTGGPFPLAYVGVSDLFILIFFGWVSTESVFYLLTGHVDPFAFLAATQIGLLAIVPHAINNLRDFATDSKVNKKTLAVRFGPRFARWEIILLSLIPFALGLFWLAQGKGWMAGLPFLAFPSVIKNLQMIWQTEPNPLYNGYLAKSALCQLYFSILLAIGIFLP